MKHKFSLIWRVAVALVLVLSFSLVAAVPAAANGVAATEVCGCLDGTNTQWVTGQTHTGTYTPELSGAYTTVSFVPDGGVLLSDLDDIDADPEWSYWYHLASTLSGHGVELELRFTAATYDPTEATGAGHVDVTVFSGASDFTEGAWTLRPVLASSGAAIYYGNDPTDGTAFSTEINGHDPHTLATVEAGINAEAAMTAGGDSASNWELTRVLLQLWIPNQVAMVDKVTIDGTTYDLEPCYFLEPDIAKNVKTSDATFTVEDACGTALHADFVSNWIVTKGEGTGVVVVTAGGEDTDNFITVRMITTGDCIITVDVEQDEGEGTDVVTLHAEKKWGEIDSTVLTAWEALLPTVAHDRAAVEVDDQILIKEQVVANFLPGLVPANAGGAKITWWLLENDALDECQDALEDLIQRFDDYEFEEGNLGWGEGCGQYGSWAGDVTFIPEDIINSIYATCAASDTEFVKAEGTVIATTKTVTYTDEAGGTLGEGFTNVTVEFSEVGTSGEVEPVIVVLLADYPLDKNGENAVCVEYFKFSPLPLVEYKDVQTLVVDIIDPVTEEIDPIRKMLYVFVRDYDESPAVDESVEFAVDGPYGLFEALLAGTNIVSDVGCYDASAYPAGITPGSQYAVSTTRLATTAEIAEFDGVVTGTGSGEPLDLVYETTGDVSGYAIAGVKIVSSHCEDVDVLIYVHDCYGSLMIVITRDVMVTGFCPEVITLESISALPSSVTLDVEDTQQLTVTATYSDASTAVVTTSADCTYVSGVPAVATVTSPGGGLITAVAEGDAIITVSYTEGGITKTDTVSVTVGFDPWIYDTNDNDVMEIGEVLNAISDYFAEEITITQVLEVIALYF